MEQFCHKKTIGGRRREDKRKTIGDRLVVTVMGKRKRREQPRSNLNSDQIISGQSCDLCACAGGLGHVRSRLVVIVGMGARAAGRP